MKELIKTKDMAKRVNISTRKLRYWASTGKVPACYLSKQMGWRFDPDEVIEAMKLMKKKKKQE